MYLVISKVNKVNSYYIGIIIIFIIIKNRFMLMRKCCCCWGHLNYESDSGWNEIIIRSGLNSVNFCYSLVHWRRIWCVNSWAWQGWWSGWRRKERCSKIAVWAQAASSSPLNATLPLVCYWSHFPALAISACSHWPHWHC